MIITLFGTTHEIDENALSPAAKHLAAACPVIPRSRHAPYPTIQSRLTNGELVLAGKLGGLKVQSRCDERLQATLVERRRVFGDKYVDAKPRASWYFPNFESSKGETAQGYYERAVREAEAAGGDPMTFA